MLDTSGFLACTIARAKTGEVQQLEIPEVLRPFLRAWHERAGKPSAGAVFPVRRGRRAGQARTGRGVSFAQRLRRELFKAGVMRHPPVTGPDGKAAPNPADPIYFDTPVSKRVDFHSFRRAYNTALAGAGVNVQTAMSLASHSDPKTHMRHVMQAEAAKPVPSAALPAIDPAIAARLLSPAVTDGHRNNLNDPSQLYETTGAGHESRTRQTGGAGAAPGDGRGGVVIAALHVVEVFSGAGGIAAGFARAGLDIELAFDFDEDACQSYMANLGRRPVRVDARDLLRVAGGGWRPLASIDLLVADPPCAPWSRAGNREGRLDPRDMLEVTEARVGLG